MSEIRTPHKTVDLKEPLKNTCLKVYLMNVKGWKTVGISVREGSPLYNFLTEGKGNTKGAGTKARLALEAHMSGSPCEPCEVVKGSKVSEYVTSTIDDFLIELMGMKPLPDGFLDKVIIYMEGLEKAKEESK